MEESVEVSWPEKLSLSFDLQYRPHRCTVSLFGRPRPGFLLLILSISNSSPSTEGVENHCYAESLSSRVLCWEAWSAVTIQHPSSGLKPAMKPAV